MTESHTLPGASRDPVDRITDEMLTRPLRTLTFAERAMIRRANSGDRSEEFLLRVKQLHQEKERLSVERFLRREPESSSPDLIV